MLICAFGKRAHPNAAWLNYREVPDPVSSFIEPRGNRRTYVARGRHRDSEKHNAARCWQASAPCKLAEILIEREQDAIFSYRPSQYLFPALRSEPKRHRARLPQARLQHQPAYSRWREIAFHATG